MNSDGIISGIPVQAEQKLFTVQVKDANDAIANKLLSLTISAPQESDLDIVQGGATIDGNISEFFISNSVSFADTSGRGNNFDNSAIAKIMWDNNNLYIGVKVVDSQLNAIINENDITNLYKDD